MSKRMTNGVAMPWRIVGLVVGAAVFFLLAFVLFARSARADGPTVTADGWAFNMADWRPPVGRGRNSQDTLYARQGDNIVYRVHIAGRGTDVPLRIVVGAALTEGSWFSVAPEHSSHWVLQRQTATSWELVFEGDLVSHTELVFYFKTDFRPNWASAVISASVPGWEDVVVVHRLPPPPQISVLVNPAQVQPGGTVDVTVWWTNVESFQICFWINEQVGESCHPDVIIPRSQWNEGSILIQGVLTPNTMGRLLHVRAWGPAGGTVVSPWIQIVPPGYTVTT